MSDSKDNFFLPDLCRNQAALMLIIVAELFAIVLVLVDSGLRHFDWMQLALLSLYMQWVSLSSAFLLCRLRPWLMRQRGSLRIWGGFLVVPLNTWLFSAVTTVLIDQEAGFSLALLFADHVLRDVAVSAILGGLVFRYFHLQAQLLARSQGELQHRLQALQSRIKPHFLFNSMNSIASLISIDPEAAETAVEDLAALFRASLGDVGHQVPLHKERELCERYLRIEQLRLGKRLRVVWKDHGVPEDVGIPLLTLQPLLENAIVHGIQPLPEGGDILIELAYRYGVFEVKVVNPCPPENAPGRDDDHGNRMALENIRHRLRALYGERAKLTAYAEQNRYVCHLSYPYPAAAPA